LKAPDIESRAQRFFYDIHQCLRADHEVRVFPCFPWQNCRRFGRTAGKIWPRKTRKNTDFEIFRFADERNWERAARSSYFVAKNKKPHQSGGAFQISIRRP